MAHDELPTNPTNNRPFEDILEAHLKRRTVLAGGVAAAATTFFGASAAGAVASSATAAGDAAAADGHDDLIGFEPIGLDSGPVPLISPDYEYSVVIPWGTKLKASDPDFSWPQTSSAAQERQVGIGHDGMWFFPTGRGSDRNRRGVLAINHEFGRNTHVFGKPAPESLEDVRISQAAHGISMIEIRQTTFGNWEVVPGGRRSSRVHVNTPVDFSGPAAGSPLLETPAGNEATGTLNNCANGYTPWGTYLTCEENTNGYFGGHRRVGGLRGPGPLWLHDHRIRLRLGELRSPLRPQRPRLHQRREPVRLDRRGRPVPADKEGREAHRAWPGQARGHRDRHRARREDRLLHG